MKFTAQVAVKTFLTVAVTMASPKNTKAMVSKRKNSPRFHRIILFSVCIFWGRVAFGNGREVKYADEFSGYGVAGRGGEGA